MINKFLKKLAAAYFFTHVPHGVLRDPDPRLHRVAEDVKRFDATLRERYERLKAALREIRGPFRGIGIAAPQMGFDQRLVVMRMLNNRYEAFVNPHIIIQRWQRPAIERCFSVEGFYVVNRYRWIRVAYHDLNGKPKKRTLTGARAVIFQQEVDHLNGILISEK